MRADITRFARVVEQRYTALAPKAPRSGGWSRVPTTVTRPPCGFRVDVGAAITCRLASTPAVVALPSAEHTLALKSFFYQPGGEDAQPLAGRLFFGTD